MPRRTEPANHIGRRREELGLTQAAVAKAAGIGQGTLSVIERSDTTNLEGRTLLGLAKALRKSPEWVATATDPPVALPDSAFRQLLAALNADNRRIYYQQGQVLLANQESATPPVTTKRRPPKAAA